MGITARNRSRSIPQVGTVEYWSDGSVFLSTHPTANLFYQACADIIGDYGGNHAFELTTRDNRGVQLISGVRPSGPYAGSNASSVPVNYTVVPVTTDPIDDISATELASRTNVNRPDVNPLSLGQDLFDLPRMLRDAGRLMRPNLAKELSLRELANKNLAVQFGWLPLISDVRKLLQTQKRVEKRFARLRHLYDNGGERRRLDAGESHAEKVTQNVTLFSDFLIGDMHADVKFYTSVRVWYTVRWKLLYRPPEYRNFPAMQNQAWRIANGLTVRGLFEGVWDLVPWSFLVDWFTDASDFVSEHLNTVPVQFASASKMTHTQTSAVFSRNPNTTSWITGGEGVAWLDSKLRSVVSPPSITSSLPNIGLRDASVLGSLFVQRFLR